ncbi:MAG: hypothetical protein EHM84_02365, partial [Lysobacterales bacterium]
MRSAAGVAAPVSGFVAFIAASFACAADMDLSVHMGDTYTDNVAFTSESPTSDHVMGVASKIGLAVLGPQLEAEARAALTYLHYVEDSFDDQFQRGFAGDFRLNFFDGRLAWIATENYGPVLEDPLSTDQPENWTYDSYFTTGPDLIVGSPTSTHLLVGARYGRVDYEVDTVPSNEQYTANLALVFPTSAQVEKSINLSARRVNQESVETSASTPTEPEEDYDIGEAYLHFASNGIRNSLSIDAGASMLSSAETPGADKESSTGP